MSSQKPQSEYPHAEVEALDKENVARLLEINVKFQSLFRKHPFFETDPVCRLARQLAIEAGYRPEAIDLIAINGGYSLESGPVPMTYVTGPGPGANSKYDERHWAFPDFLTSGNRPRPIWMAWIPQAKMAIEALKKLDGVADA